MDPAMYLGPQYGTRTSLVSSLIGSPDSLELKIFAAKSIRCLNKIVYEPKFGPDFIARTSDSPSPALMKREGQLTYCHLQCQRPDPQSSG